MPNKDDDFSVDEILAEISASDLNAGGEDDVDVIISDVLDSPVKKHTVYERGDFEKQPVTEHTSVENRESFEEASKAVYGANPADVPKQGGGAVSEAAEKEAEPAVKDDDKQADEAKGRDYRAHNEMDNAQMNPAKKAFYDHSEGGAGFEEDLSDDLECVCDKAELSDGETSQFLAKHLKTAKICSVFTFIIAVVAVAIEALNWLPGITPNIISAAASPAVYSAVNLILLALGILAAYKPFLYGLTALVKLKANKFSMISFAAAGCLIHNVVIAINLPNDVYGANVHLYSAVALLGLAFACAAYKTGVMNAVLSFKAVSSKYDKYGAVIMKEEYSAAYTKGLVSDLPVLAFRKQAGRVRNFAGRAFSRDMTDSVAATLTVIVAAAAVILGASVGYSMRSVNVGFTVFAAIAVVSAPLTYALGSGLTMSKSVKRLMKLGATIVGSGGIDFYSCVNSIVIDAKSLFPQDAVTLHGIKTFGGARIDEAIVAAASVACAGNSLLTDLFMQIVSGKKNMLKPVEGLLYEDGCGLAGWVEKKRVLIGTRELMLSHGVDAPSKEYEERYTDGRNDLIYLSVGGELSAVFIIELAADPSVAHALRMLEYKDVAIAIDTADPIITAEKAGRLFGVDHQMLKILPARLKDELKEAEGYQEEVSSSVISNATVCSFAAAVCEAKKTRSSFVLQIIVHLASVLAGFAMIAVFAFMRDFTQLTTQMLLIYQCMWAVFCIIVAKVK